MVVVTYDCFVFEKLLQQGWGAPSMMKALLKKEERKDGGIGGEECGFVLWGAH